MRYNKWKWFYKKKLKCFTETLWGLWGLGGHEPPVSLHGLAINLSLLKKKKVRDLGFR